MTIKEHSESVPKFGFPTAPIISALSDKLPPEPVCYGRAIIFGVRPIKSIVNIPSDSIGHKVRLRGGELGKAYVRFIDRVEEWVIQPSGDVLSADTWILGVLQGVNYAGCSADATKRVSR